MICVRWVSHLKMVGKFLSIISLLLILVVKTCQTTHFHQLEIWHMTFGREFPEIKEFQLNLENSLLEEILWNELSISKGKVTKGKVTDTIKMNFAK